MRRNGKKKSIPNNNKGQKVQYWVALICKNMHLIAFNSPQQLKMFKRTHYVHSVNARLNGSRHECWKPRGNGQPQVTKGLTQNHHISCQTFPFHQKPSWTQKKDLYADGLVLFLACNALFAAWYSIPMSHIKYRKVTATSPSLRCFSSRLF